MFNVNKLFVLLFFVSIVLLVSVPAQLNDIENKIENVTENLDDKADKIRELTEQDKWDFIGAQWKEFLLRNKAISGINNFFAQIDIVFVVLFSLHWAISIEMLLVFMLWLFTGLSVYGYLTLFKNNLSRWVASFIIAIILAHVKFYYIISHAMFKLIFFKQDTWWNLITFVICIFLGILYLKINRLISQKLKESRENAEKQAQGRKLKEIETFNKELQSK